MIKEMERPHPQIDSDRHRAKGKVNSNKLERNSFVRSKSISHTEGSAVGLQLTQAG